MTYKLADGKDIIEYLISAEIGEKVELLSEKGEKTVLNFFGYSNISSDLCRYGIFSDGQKLIVMRVNFKYRYLTLIDDARLCNKIIKEFNSEKASAQNEGEKSSFTGGAFINAIIDWVTVFVSLISAGLLYPAMVCWKSRWKAKHTYINGRQLTFDGKALQLFGRFILWLFLSVITFGIYYVISMKVSITKWEIRHTHFADSAEKADGEGNSLSEFDGHWYQLLGVNLLTGLVTVITLTFGSYWAHCYKERWFCKHKIIDGQTLCFDGTAIRYFCKRILWILLTVITVGIYSFWLKIKSFKWTISHTFIK